MTCYDIALFLSIPSVIIFFLVLRTEFLRLDQVRAVLECLIIINSEMFSWIRLKPEQIPGHLKVNTFVYQRPILMYQTPFWLALIITWRRRHCWFKTITKSAKEQWKQEVCGAVFYCDVSCVFYTNEEPLYYSEQTSQAYCHLIH